MEEGDRIDAKEALGAVVTGIKSGRKGRGYLVETPHGKGRTLHDDSPINGKIAIYLSNGRKLLCSPDKLSKKEIVKMIGNAVPVGMARALLETTAKYLLEMETERVAV